MSKDEKQSSNAFENIEQLMNMYTTSYRLLEPLYLVLQKFLLNMNLCNLSEVNVNVRKLSHRSRMKD